jgi:hypothetical protein
MKDLIISLLGWLIELSIAALAVYGFYFLYKVITGLL